MAYTYEFDGVQWNHGAALAAYDPQTIDYFGRAVAIVDREVIVARRVPMRPGTSISNAAAST